MGHRGRVRDQAFHPTQRFGQGEVLQAFDEGAHFRFTALQLDAEHRAEPVLLARGQRMPRMRGKARVMQRAHGRMAVEQFDQRLRVLLVHAQTRIQRAQATQGEEAVERGTGQAKAIRPPGQ